MDSLKTQIPLRIGRDWYGNELTFPSITFNLQGDLSFQTSPHDVTHSTPTPHMLGSTHARVGCCSMLVTSPRLIASRSAHPTLPKSSLASAPESVLFPFLAHWWPHPFCALPRLIDLWLLAKVHACRCSRAHPPHPPSVILGTIPSPLVFVLERRTSFPSWSPFP